MEKEDLVVGKKYKTGNELLEFMGLDKDSDPIFKPLNDSAKRLFALYDEDCEKKDPLCKVGYLGFTYLVNLKLVKSTKESV